MYRSLKNRCKQQRTVEGRYRPVQSHRPVQRRKPARPAKLLVRLRPLLLLKPGKGKRGKAVKVVKEGKEGKEVAKVKLPPPAKGAEGKAPPPLRAAVEVQRAQAAQDQEWAVLVEAAVQGKEERGQ